MDNFALRNFRDFLLLYNKISEACFTHCVNELGERDLSQDENRCVDVCIRKFVNVNHKVMQVYMEVQPQFVNKRIEEMNKQQAAKVEMNNSSNGEIANIQEVKVNTAGS